MNEAAPRARQAVWRFLLLALAALSLIQATPWYTQWKKARQAKKSA